MNRKKILYVSSLALLIVFGMNALGNTKTELEIPEKEDILIYGYPENEMGETYGPHIPELEKNPDLSLAQGKNGIIGYIRNSEADPDVNTLEEAMAYMEKGREEGFPDYTIPLYLQDGKTVIGEFVMRTGEVKETF